MSDEQKCTLTWRGDSGKGKNKYARSLIMSVSSDAAAQTLATALTAHTDCNCAFASFNERTEITDSHPAASADTGVKGEVFFRNAANLRVGSITIPAPVATDIEDLGAGKVYKTASVATIVALIATATGLTLTPLHGTYRDDRS